MRIFKYFDYLSFITIKNMSFLYLGTYFPILLALSHLISKHFLNTYNVPDTKFSDSDTKIRKVLSLPGRPVI